jgi:hypothetical protein
MDNIIQFELSNECTCEEYDYTESAGVEVFKPAEYCFGDCFNDAKENLYYDITQPWLQRNGLEHGDPIKVVGTNMNWNGVSGVGVFEADREGIVDAVSINASYRVVFRLDGNRLTANRYSHDEPTGSPEFFFVPEVYEEGV